MWRLWLRRRAGATDSVRDVVQEVMLRLVARGREGMGRCPDGGRESFDGYLRRIAEHLIVDELRRRHAQSGPGRRLIAVDPRRFETGFGGDDPPHDGFYGPERPVIHRETMEAIRRSLDGMSRDPRQQRLNRHLFQLYFLDGISMAQIARLRSVPLSASSVSRRIRAIRARLREVFPAPARRSPAHRGRQRASGRSAVAKRV